MSTEILIKELNTHQEMMKAYPIIKQRYPEMTLESYSAQAEEMIARSDYKIIAAFDGDEILGVAGYWIQRMLYCGRYLQLSNFIVDEQKRGSGVGKMILAKIDSIAREHKCDKIALDSYTENKKSHSLYFREGFYIRGFHFMKDL